MSFQRIINPYWLYPTAKMTAAGIEDWQCKFPNKVKARAFIKRIQQTIDPDWKPLLDRDPLRFEDTTTGKLYRNKWEYWRDQERAREYHERMDRERAKRDERERLEQCYREQQAREKSVAEILSLT